MSEAHSTGRRDADPYDHEGDMCEQRLPTVVFVVAPHQSAVADSFSHWRSLFISFFTAPKPSPVGEGGIVSIANTMTDEVSSHGAQILNYNTNP